MGNREINLLSLINLSLEVAYCSTILSNHSPIRLKNSSHNYTRGYGMSFISYSHLILLISGQTFEITAGPNFFLESKHSLRMEPAALKSSSSSAVSSCFLPKRSSHGSI